LKKYIGEIIQLSFVAQNIGPAGSEANEGLPLQLKAGVGVKAMNLVDVGIDVVKQMDGGVSAGIGMEYLFRNLIAFRTGGVLSRDSLSKFSVGLGVQQKIGKFKYHLDYAMVPFGSLGMTHRIGMKMDIGKIELPDKTELYYYKGVDYFIQNNFEDAVKMWEKVLAKDPEHPEARKRIDEVKKILKFQEQEKELKKVQENFQKFQMEQQQKSGEKPAEPKKK
jgi:predicted RND superfamily exporter protein